MDVNREIQTNLTGHTIIVTGGTHSGMHPTLARFSSAGAEIWDRSYVDNVNDPLSSGVALDSSGSIFITGRYDGPGSYDVMIRKHTSSGGETWTTTYDGGTTQDVGNGIAMDSSGNAVVGYHSRKETLLPGSLLRWMAINTMACPTEIP